MRVNLKETAPTSQRYGVNDRATAMIATSVLKDVGLVSRDASELVTDRSIIRRERNKVREEVKLQAQQHATPTRGLYFDGRRDDTLTQVKQGAKLYRRTVKEEHISIISQPRSKYLGHVIPKSGSVRDICDSIYELVLKETDLNELVVVGCVGTTGAKGGVIRCLENKLGRSLHCIICLLHFNELPFRSLFEFIDGGTSGPKSFAGPVVVRFKNVESLPLVSYNAIQCSLPDVGPVDLSKDQKYLLNNPVFARLTSAVVTRYPYPRSLADLCK